jgi:hypothetical protein
MKLCCLALLAALAPAAALAGADSADGHDEVPPNPEEGPAYFGFVKDASGVPVRDAKVSASYRNNLTFAARSNATGAYRLPGFRKGINPDEVVILCSKEGYRQLRVFRYPPPRGRPVTAVETECRLQREKP